MKSRKAKHYTHVPQNERMHSSHYKQTRGISRELMKVVLPAICNHSAAGFMVLILVMAFIQIDIIMEVPTFERWVEVPSGTHPRMLKGAASIHVMIYSNGFLAVVEQ